MLGTTPTSQWFNFMQTLVAKGPNSTIEFRSMGNQNRYGCGCCFTGG